MGSIISFIWTTIGVYQGLIAISALLTWLPNASNSAFGRFVNRLTDPYVGIFERYIPAIGGVSFSALIAIFSLDIVKRLLIALLFRG